MTIRPFLGNHIVVALTALTLSWSVLPVHAENTVSMTGCPEDATDCVEHENITLIRDFVAEVVNGGNIDAIPDYWHDDMVWRGGSLGEYHGIEAYMDFVRATAGTAFTDMYLEIDEIHAIGDDLVIDRFTNSGMNSASFMGYEATNRRAQWDGMAFYRIRDGKIAEAWFAEDILSIFFQLELLEQ